MQIPLSYAEDIIGVGGGNIAYIRRTSGAILTVQESRGLPDELGNVETLKREDTKMKTKQKDEMMAHFCPTKLVAALLRCSFRNDEDQMRSNNWYVHSAYLNICHFMIFLMGWGLKLNELY